MADKTPEQERQALGFLLPDLLGKPDGATNDKGEMKITGKVPLDNFIFFIPINEWRGFTK